MREEWTRLQMLADARTSRESQLLGMLRGLLSRGGNGGVGGGGGRKKTTSGSSSVLSAGSSSSSAGPNAGAAPAGGGGGSNPCSTGLGRGLEDENVGSQEERMYK